jgi:gliding motility-associated-like protein
MFMNRDKKRKSGLLFACMLSICAMYAQDTEYYTVTGGKGTPLQVANSDRIQVYLVYGLENLQISYTSPSTPHQWYRYKIKADENEAEKVSSVQTGTTSVVTDVEEGYGYFVLEEKGNWFMNRFVWIMDYSNCEPDLRSFRVAPDFEECEGIRFEGDADIRDLVYYTPTGSPKQINREFELSYSTLEWNDALKSFSPLEVSKTFNTNPFATTFRPSGVPERNFPLILTDTEILLSGDLFARHFGVEKSVSIPYYEAQAIEVHTDTAAVYIGPGGNVQAEVEGELLAPTEVTFRADANIPVASVFIWKILRLNESDTTELIRFNGEELVYTFDRDGVYEVALEVSSSRSKKCEYREIFNIVITETLLEIPNAFSPGCTPGINDIFRVRSKSVVNFRGWIFNRWGTELFQWTDPSQGWDGTYRGKYVPAGAYYYLIEYTGTNGRKRVRKGDVNVFRTKDIKTEADPVE